MRKNIRQEIEDRLFQYSDVKPGEWNRVIAEQTKTMNRWQRQLFVMRYVQKMTEKDICRELHIERSTYYMRLDSLVSDIAIAAAYARLLKP